MKILLMTLTCLIATVAPAQQSPQLNKLDYNIGACSAVISWRSINGKPTNPELLALRNKYAVRFSSVIDRAAKLTVLLNLAVIVKEIRLIMTAC